MFLCPPIESYRKVGNNYKGAIAKKWFYAMRSNLKCVRFMHNKEDGFVLFKISGYIVFHSVCLSQKNCHFYTVIDYIYHDFNKKRVTGTCT